MKKVKNILITSILLLIIGGIYIYIKNINVIKIQQPTVSNSATNITTSQTIINQGTVGNFGSVRIGVISISKPNTEKITSLLQLMFPNDPSKNKKEEVYIGKKIITDEYEFTIDSIDTQISLDLSGSPSGYIILTYIKK